MKKILSLILCFLILIIATGCGKSASENESKKNTSKIIDATGKEFLLSQKPERIISFTLSSDEMLTDLVDHKKLIAVTYLADDKYISNVVNKVKDIPKRIDRNPSPENVLQFKPDIVFVADFIQPEIIKTLRELQLNVYVYKNPTNIEEVKNVIRELGRVLGEEINAENIVGNIDKRLKTLEERLKNIPVDKSLRVVSFRPGGNIYYNPKSSFYDICKYAHVRDALQEFEEDKPFSLNEEQLVRLNPDVFIVPDWNYDGKHDTKEKLNEIEKISAYKNIKAVKNGNIHVINASKVIVSSQYMVDAAENLAKTIYPEQF